MKIGSKLGIAAGLAFAGHAAPALANGAVKSSSAGEDTDQGFEGELSTTVIGAKLSQADTGDATDSSGIGAHAGLAYSGAAHKLRFRLEVDASVFEYREPTRNSRTTTRIGGEVNQDVTKDLSIGVSAARAFNMITLESVDANQTSTQAGLTWKRGKHQVEAGAGYRWRQYNDGLASRGKGGQLSLRYRHSFGSWHWAAARAGYDQVQSPNRLYGYKRASFALDYNLPIASRLRAVAGFDVRSWKYDGRHISGNPAASQRRDQLYRPEIGLSYGNSKGLFGRATLAYDVRRSNDVRYRNDGLRVGLTAGFSF